MEYWPSEHKVKVFFPEIQERRSSVALFNLRLAQTP